MTHDEWFDKYTQMIKLAKELGECPYYMNLEIHCNKCIFRNKCTLVRAIISLSSIA